MSRVLLDIYWILLDISISKHLKMLREESTVECEVKLLHHFDAMAKI